MTVVLAFALAATACADGLRLLPPVEQPLESPVEPIVPPPAWPIVPPPAWPMVPPPARDDEPGAVVLAAHQPWCDDATATPPFEVGAQFDKGVFVRSTNLDETPFALYIGARMQLRHTGFTRSEESWTDNAGVTRTIRNRNNFDSERLRLNLSGTAISPDLDYYVVLDGDSDGGSTVDALAYIVTYEISPSLQFRLGRWKAAADREWLLSSRHLRMVDRSMATEYFRAGFTDGVWLLGDFRLFDRTDGRRPWRYEASLTNGLRTSTRQASNLDDNLALAATVYCDPLGDYGATPNDFEWSESPVVRVGASVGLDKTDDRSDAGVTFALGDDNFLRLSDGTRLADVGALAPGVRLLGDRVTVAAFDVGMKYRGWSASAEYFIRSIDDLAADGPLPVGDLYDYGYHAEVGRFLIPQRLDVNLRVSQVSGLLGNGFEYTGGFNFFWGGTDCQSGKNDDRINKFSFDASRVIQSPVTSTGADLVAGDDGWLFRTQVQVGF